MLRVLQAEEAGEPPRLALEALGPQWISRSRRARVRRLQPEDASAGWSDDDRRAA
ncbi:hypothetical protein N9L68_00410 [bacterium]|nr:hypothetical protein [bacterium]